MSDPIAQFSGLSSGINSAELIDAIITAREAENTSRKAEIDHLNSEDTALEDLNTKILALYDLVDQLRTANGGGIKKTASSTDSSIVSATAGSSSLSSTLSLEVKSLANTATASFDPTVAYTSEDDAISSGAGTGDVSVLVGTGANQKTITVSVEGGSTTLREFVDAFNADSNADGVVSASLVNVGTPSTPKYKVVFNTLTSGIDEGQIAFNVNAIHSTQLGNTTIEQASNAKIAIGGITGDIERFSNSVSDIVTGLTLQLSDKGTASLSISQNTDGTSTQMQKIVDAYNEIVAYIAENNTVSSSTNRNGQVALTFGSLAKTRLDDGFLTDFRSRLAETQASDGVAVQQFSELGLKTNRDGTLTLDVSKFKEALAADPTGAYQVITSFADEATGTEGFLPTYTQFQGLIDLAQKANASIIENIQNKISQVERGAENERMSLTQMFARLEATSGELQNKQMYAKQYDKDTWVINQFDVYNLRVSESTKGCILDRHSI